ncbi:hypothetical protein ACLMJK_004110 [Lecanora helva]
MAPQFLDINQNLSALETGLALENITTKNADFSVTIENCGADTNAIMASIRQMKTYALKAQADAVHGIRSIYGFESMFKDDSASESVEAIYNALYHFEAIPGLKPDPTTTKAPRFACAREESAQTYKNLDLGYDPWQRCLAGSPRRNPVPAFYAEGTAYIFLCPGFAVQEAQPDRPHCPAVHDNRFAGDPYAFYKKYQTYTLLYHLTRFYLGDNALDDQSDPREQLDWNNVVLLNIIDSIRNPTNLQIYAACE